MIGWPRTMVIQYVNALLLIIPEMCNGTNVDIYLVSDEGQEYPRKGRGPKTSCRYLHKVTPKTDTKLSVC